MAFAICAAISAFCSFVPLLAFTVTGALIAMAGIRLIQTIVRAKPSEKSFALFNSMLNSLGGNRASIIDCRMKSPEAL